MLQHQLNVLRRQVERPVISYDDRTLLGAITATRLGSKADVSTLPK
ncbi:MAG: hypothetical protein GY708_11970 [Actinomycetia bacterium]|nr:hypothetical protein [Actinomycetes bacterium]MCP4958970.1 hypothetical protein [Actinomycetes bacterium]